MAAVRAREIPEYIIMMQAMSIENQVARYFDDPEHKEQFEKWLERRKKNESGAHTSNIMLDTGMVDCGISICKS